MPDGVLPKFDGFLKRNGLVVPFHEEKIANAIRKAFEAVARHSGESFAENVPDLLALEVVEQLNNPLSEYFVHPTGDGKRIPKIEDVQDLVEIIMAENSYTLAVTAYKRYRKQRDLARQKIRVRGSGRNRMSDPTDASLLLVTSITGDMTSYWDRNKIIQQLLEIGLCIEEAAGIAKIVENLVLSSRVEMVNTALIRELVNNELVSRGYHTKLRDLSVYAIPKSYIEALMNIKSTENSNIVNNNPEAVNLGIAELLLKQWALESIFSPEIKRAHDTGMIHLHDLGYPHRVYCSSHSVEYVKKYGLQRLLNLNTESKPARNASVLTGHINTFLATMQANYAGALGIAYINVLYAPLLQENIAEGESDEKYRRRLKQMAQELIFNGSQNAFSRGGQTLFLDFNIHCSVPSYLKDVPAIGKGGKYMLRRPDGTVAYLEEILREDTDHTGYPLMNLVLQEPGKKSRIVLKELCDAQRGLCLDPKIVKDLADRGEKIVTYGDFEAEAQAFALALLDVWEEGDRHGRVFEFPKCDFHVNEEAFTDPRQRQILERACRLAGTNGSTYFIFDRDEVTLSACCRLRTTITDNRMLRHPESLRFCGFQNVTINIPQAAYRASKAGRATIEGLVEELDQMMELCARAHLEKRQKIAEMMSEPGRPLYQIGQPSCDGKPYVELDKCTYIIGLIGVNDAVQFLTGQQLHDSESAQEMGLKIVAHMFLKAKKLSRKYGLKFSLEESPAESAARRLAKTDLLYYPDQARQVVKGNLDDDSVYYTNSVHLSADAPVNLVQRIREQSKYHSMIESGAIIHAFVGEEKPSPESIYYIVKESFYRTQCAQLTISPEFTYCNDCRQQERGIRIRCGHCGSQNVYGESRVVGYFSRIDNWNRSKRYGELLARQKGRYSVETAAQSHTPKEHLTIEG